MAQNVKVCDIEPSLKEKLNKFRFRRDQIAALIMKIDKATMNVVLEEELEDCDLDEVVESLSEHNPRYLVYSFKQEHDDGRISYPMVFIYVTPQGANPEIQMMYAGSKTALVHETGMTKVFELRNLEELTEEWLIAKLKRLY